jgi:hypothetical protein
MQMSRINRLVHNQRNTEPRSRTLGTCRLIGGPEQPKMRESSLVSNFKMNANRAVMTIWSDRTKRGRFSIFWNRPSGRYEQRFDGFNGTATLFIAIKMWMWTCWSRDVRRAIGPVTGWARNSRCPTRWRH